MKRRKTKEPPPPPPDTYICIWPHCARKCFLDDVGEIDYSNDEVCLRLMEWHGPPPEFGCKQCGWPVIKLNVYVKDFSLGNKLASAGMAKAMTGVTEAWKAACFDVVLHTAQRLPVLCSEDLHPEIDELEYLNDGRPVNYSSTGPVLTLAAKMGIITRASSAESQRPHWHKRLVRTWVSLVYGDSDNTVDAHEPEISEELKQARERCESQTRRADFLLERKDALRGLLVRIALELRGTDHPLSDGIMEELRAVVGDLIQ